MPAYYGRARRDYEPDVVYVEPRRRSYDDEYDRRAPPRESERERELQDELRRTRRALLEMRQERAAVDVAERPRFVAMSPKRRGDAVQGFAERRDDYDDDEFVVVERRPDELRVVAPVGVADLGQLIERDLHAHERKEKW